MFLAQGALSRFLSNSLLPCPCPPRTQSLLCEEHRTLLLEKGRWVGQLREAEAAWLTRGWRDRGGRE